MEKKDAKVYVNVFDLATKKMKSSRGCADVNEALITMNELKAALQFLYTDVKPQKDGYILRDAKGSKGIIIQLSNKGNWLLGIADTFKGVLGNYSGDDVISSKMLWAYLWHNDMIIPYIDKMCGDDVSKMCAILDGIKTKIDFYDFLERATNYYMEQMAIPKMA